MLVQVINSLDIGNTVQKEEGRGGQRKVMIAKNMTWLICYKKGSDYGIFNKNILLFELTKVYHKQRPQ